MVLAVSTIVGRLENLEVVFRDKKFVLKSIYNKYFSVDPNLTIICR